MGEKPLSGIHRETTRLKNQIRDIAWTHAGPIRDETQMREGLSLLRDAEKGLHALKARHWSDLISMKKVENSLLVIQSILESSLARHESVGAFQRTDYPHQSPSGLRQKVSIKIGEKGEGLKVHQA